MTLLNLSALARTASAALLLLIAGAAGFFAYRVVSTHRPTLTVASLPATKGPTTIGPTGSTAAGEEANDGSLSGTNPARSSKIPEVLPEISLPDRDGHPHRLGDWKGRPLVVNFWATWCEPCRREIPLLKSLRAENRADSLEVIGIAVDFRDAVVKYAQDAGIDYPLLIGEDSGLAAIEAFGMEAVFPFSVFADAQGRIVTLKVGELRRDEADFILARLRQVDEGRMDLPAARRQIAEGLSKLAAERARIPD